MRIKKHFLGLIFFVVGIATLFSVINIPKVYAPSAEANDTITIFVNVSQKTLVDINPSSLSWYNVEPGKEYNASVEKNNYENIWIENIGSVNITKIWLNNSYPSSRPFGTGNPLAYDPANFVVVANNSINSPDSPFMYINRVEYEEDDPLYLKVPDTNLANIGIIFGRLRNASTEYFFEYVSNYPGTNCSNGNLYINTSSPKTVSSTGDVDLRDQTPIPFTPVTLNTGGGVLDGQQYDVGKLDFGNGEQYCVFIPVSCPATGAKVFFVRWNADFLADPNVQTICGSSMNNGYLNKNAIPPGGFYKAWVHVRIPYGTATGNLNTGTLTVYASSA